MPQVGKTTDKSLVRVTINNTVPDIPSRPIKYTATTLCGVGVQHAVYILTQSTMSVQTK